MTMVIGLRGLRRKLCRTQFLSNAVSTAWPIVADSESRDTCENICSISWYRLFLHTQLIWVIALTNPWDRSIYKVEMDWVAQYSSAAMGVVIVQCRRSSAVSSVRNADWSYFTVTLTVVLSSSTAQWWPVTLHLLALTGREQHRLSVWPCQLSHRYFLTHSMLRHYYSVFLSHTSQLPMNNYRTNGWTMKPTFRFFRDWNCVFAVTYMITSFYAVNSSSFFLEITRSICG